MAETELRKTPQKAVKSAKYEHKFKIEYCDEF